MSIQNQSRDFLMTPRHHLNVPESILRTSISDHSHDSNEIVAISQWLPASWFDAVFLIGKIIKKTLGFKSRILHLMDFSQQISWITEHHERRDLEEEQEEVYLRPETHKVLAS